uniref:Uncharacterized protein n=1 Tax=Timema poppense TaxID=170557 RepID=A0A7R9DAS2_TIMPO|nr:unnamed protein product [Timema poppensis]
MSDQLSINTKKTQLSDKHILKWRKMRAVKKIKKISQRKVTVIMDENELNGKRRFVADGFSQERECQVMLELSKIAAIEGDGYNGNISPHTSSERFEGVTLGRAALGWDELSHWARGYWREWEAACLHPPRSLA